MVQTLSELTPIRLIKRWLRKTEDCSVALMVAMILPAMLTAVALATDISVWFLERQRLQFAADSAAYAASFQLSNATMTAGGESSFATLINNEVKQAVGTRLVGTLGTPLITLGSGNANITLRLSSTADTFFAGAAHLGAPTITVQSQAGAVTAPTCLLALNTNQSDTLEAQNGGTISAATCGGMANSTASTAIYNSNSTMTFKTLKTSGNYSNSNGTVSPTPTTGVSAMADPYASLTRGTIPACTYTNQYFESSNTAYHFTTGAVFCGSTGIGGNGGTVAFDPGIYYVVGTSSDTFAFNQSTVTAATGVTFFVTGTTASTQAPVFEFINNGAITWTAPTSSNGGVSAGGIDGVALYQTCPTGSASGSIVNGYINFMEGSPVSYSGVIYAPCAEVELQDGAKLQPSGSLANSIVAAQIFATQGTISVQAATSGRSVAVLQ